MKKLLLIGYFFLLSWIASAQQGNFFLSEYQHDFNNLSYETSAIVQDSRGQMYFGTPKGVLHYDGNFWTQIQTGYAINDLKSYQNLIFTAGRDACGIIFIDADGKEKYRSLTPQNLKADFISIKIIGKKVYFISSVSIIEYDIHSDKIISNITPPQSDTFRECFTLANQVFVKSNAKTLWELKNQKLTPTKILLPTTLTSSFVFAEPLRTSARTLIGTFDGHFAVFDGKKFDDVDFPDREYLTNSILTDAKILNHTQIAFATFQGGVVILNIKDGKKLELSNNLTQGSAYVNYQNGLQDNEIMALGIDQNHGIWAAHEYGYTRIDSKLPISQFNYHGLEGRILDVKTVNGTVYVATGSGVYYLDEADQASIEQKMGKLIDTKTITVSKMVKNRRWQKHLNETENTSNQAVKILQKKSEKKGLFSRWRKKSDDKNTDKKSNQTKNTNSSQNTDKSEGDSKKKKGLFKKLFGKKKNKNEETNKEEETPEAKIEKIEPKKVPKKVIPKRVMVTQTIETQADPMLLLKKELVLKSVKYLFKKIPTLAGKFKQLVPYKTGVLASGRNGIYFIEGTEIRKISSLETAYLYVPEGKDYLCATSFQDEFAVIFPEKERSNILIYNELNDFLGKITQDDAGNIWVCGTGMVYRLIIDAETGEVKKTTSYALEGAEMENIYPLRKDKKLFFVTLSGIYRLENEQLVPDLSILPKISENTKLISHSDRMIWMSDRLNWCNTDGTKSQFLNLINCIPALSDVIEGEKESVWVITQNNQLYHLNLSAKYEPKNYNLYLDYVRSDKGNLLLLNNLEFDYDLGGLGFRFNMPDYFSGDKLEFRYLLKGKMQDWSEWNQNATVLFPPLEHGNYTLVVECRDAFGHVENQEVTFKVNPPYWKSSWFTGLQILFFGFLIGLTVWVNKKFNIEGLVWVRSGITLLVLILCMEFTKVSLQNYFGLDGSSPVEDFGIEVFMALLILPLERLLARAIRKPKHEEKTPY